MSKKWKLPETNHIDPTEAQAWKLARALEKERNEALDLLQEKQAMQSFAAPRVLSEYGDRVRALLDRLLREPEMCKECGDSVHPKAWHGTTVREKVDGMFHSEQDGELIYLREYVALLADEIDKLKSPL